ncbi:MAG: ATP-binding protein [Acidobacteriota bacterium]
MDAPVRPVQPTPRRARPGAGIVLALTSSSIAFALAGAGAAAQETAAQETATQGAGGAPWWLAGLLAIALVATAARLLQRESAFRKERDRRDADDRADLQFSRERLAAESERLTATVGTILEAVVATDTDGRVTAVNRAAEDLLERPTTELLGRPVAEIMPLVPEAEPDAAFDPMAVLLDDNAPIRFGERYIYRRPTSDKPAALELSGAPVHPEDGSLEGYVLAARDVTDRQTVEAELAKAQKTESLGLLAGGIAHDFNNLLTIILGNFSLIQSEGSLPASLVEPFDEAEKAAVRARGLSDQLLTFASGGAPKTASTDLGAMLAESVAFAFRSSRDTAPPKVRCDLDVPEDLPPVDVEPEQVAQVFNNLLVGARQATGEGVVEVHARARKIALGQAKLRPGTYVEVTIRDHGEGLPSEALEKIFDPYFSHEKGLAGLGLATSYSIIKRHRGSISVESTPGEGTCFTVLLRTAKGPARPRQAPKKERVEEPRSRGRVLVMDDEHSILALLSAALKRLGFEAVTTPDGQAALDACQEALDADDPFQLAILDLTIPGGMGGVDAATALAKIQSDLLLVASSGYARNPALIDYRDHGFHQVLVKPYRIPDLAELLDSLLGPAGRLASGGSP